MDKPYTPDRTTSLRHFLTVVFKRSWIILIIAILTLAIGSYLIFRIPPQYEASAKLLLERDPELEKALLLRISSSGRSEDANFSYTQESEIMTSRPVFEAVIDSLNLFGMTDTAHFATPQLREAALQRALFEIGQHLAIVPSADPNIIRVKYKSANPKLSAEIVNVLIDRYKDYRSQIFSDDQELAYLNREFDEADQRLTALRQNRANFQRQATVYSPDKEGDLLFTRLKDYDGRADALKLDIISKQSKLNALQNLVNSGSLQELPAIDLGSNNIQMQNILVLKEQLRTLEIEREQLRQKFTDSYIEVQDKTTQINALRNRINTDIKEIINVLRSSIASAEEEERTLRSNAASIRNQIAGLSGKDLEMSQLSREITESEELRSVLWKQLEEAKLTHNRKESVVRVRIINHATPPLKPLPSNRVIKLFMVLFLGLFAGISLAFFMDFFDHSFKSAEDVQRYLNLDILASIRSFET